MFLVAFDWKTTKTVLLYNMTNKQYFCFEESLIKKIGFNAQQRSLRDCRIPQQICESWRINCVIRLSLGLSTQIIEFEDKQANRCLRQESLFENQRTWSHINQFLTLVAFCFKLKDELMCLKASINLNAN